MAAAIGFVGLNFAPLLASAQGQSPSCTTAPCGYDWSANGGVTSTTSYMESHRFQRHSVVTSDGYIHIIVNTGAPTTIPGSSNSGALEMLTSPNNGLNWYPTFIFPGTVGSQSINLTVSTDDIRLVTTGMGQYLQVAYDVQGVGSGNTNAVMFTELSYTASLPVPNASNTWAPMTGYPQSVISTTSGTVYQQPAFAIDGPGNIWLTDFEIPQSGTGGTQGTGGQIGVYEYSSNPNTTSWVNTGLGNSLPCSGVSSVGSPSPNITCGGTTDSTGVQHAARPVFVPYRQINTSNPANIGVIYQSGNCLFWVTINVNNASPVSAAQELSSASNLSANPGNSGCNLPSGQSGYYDTAASISTNPITGDQYLGFAVTVASGTNSSPPPPTPTSVYALTYQASNASWMTGNGQLLTGPSKAPNTPVYVKTALVTASGASNANAYMFINYGTNSPLEAVAAPVLSQSNPTVVPYSQVAVLNHSAAGSGQSYANPRIDAPEYINANISKISIVPVWEQYTSSTTINGIAIQSLIYWNNLPN